jgi:DNA polymerase elongation subunit (family B)
VQQKVIDQLMLKQMDAALTTAEEAFERILRTPPGGPFESLIQSKTLRSTYAAPESLPHVQLTQIMERRQAGSAPRTGERVEYIVIASAKARVLDAVETPAYAVQHRLPPAWDHYVQHLQRPLEALLEVPFGSKRPDLLKRFQQICQTLAQKQVLEQGHARLRNGTWVAGRLSKGGSVQTQLNFAKRPRLDEEAN